MAGRRARAVFICMSPISDTAQAERNEVKSKPAPLRLRRLRGYAQGERESNQGYAQVQTALRTEDGTNCGE
jgi:hypothetical protein